MISLQSLYKPKKRKYAVELPFFQTAVGVVIIVDLVHSIEPGGVGSVCVTLIEN